MILGFFSYLFHVLGKNRKFYLNLIGITGVFPVKLSLYRLAFTHKSASITLKDGTNVNNERLEYLGDAILSAITAEFIYREFNDVDEGFMTKLRSRIVKRKHLNSVAVSMGIPMMITIHPHPANSSKHLYGNALEAMIGAIYLDRGYKYAAKFFRNRMIKKYVDLNSLAIKDSDYKSQLIEWAQKNRKEVIFFSHEEYDSKGKIPTFEAVVKIDQTDSGTGVGSSKKEAEQQAAKVALKEISN